MTRQKRLVAIHDISCFGRCSLTVALPILSAAGIETSVIRPPCCQPIPAGLPATLSAINPTSARFQSTGGRGLEFDSIYTGYLGSFEQLDIVSSF